MFGPAKQSAVHALCSGDQTAVKLISYDSLEENKDHIIIDATYIRSLYVSAFPFSAHSGWLDGLVGFNHDIDISLQIDEVDSSLSLPRLQRKITELESTKRAMIKAGKIVGSDITDPLDSAIDLKNKIQRGQEKLFQVSATMVIRADCLAELDRLTKLIISAMSSRMFFIGIARYRQIDGLQTVLPRAEDVLAQKRNMDSTTASLCFPFTSSELVQETGILYGVNKSNNSLVMLDRFSLNNANSITFAQSGSGKSYASKVEIIRQLAQGTDVIVIDPEREYQKLSDSVGGTTIKLSANSGEHINPFDDDLADKNDIGLANRIQDLTALISLMADGLSPEEKALVDGAIIKTYAESKHHQPTLKDFYNQVKALGGHGLVVRLEKYVTGSLAGVFTSRTNINLANRLIVFDIKDMPEGLREIMMMVIASYIQTKVKTEIKKRLLVIDEGWMLLEHDQSAKFIAGLVRRARKYWLGVSIISQQANDFLSNEYGRAIASQSSLRLLMRQDTTSIANVTDEFLLSEFEEEFLLTCGRGDGLIIADGNHVALSIVASKGEHPLITTNPLELHGG